MIKAKKKGFTIVELVIVIAVIAILAAVLIPTFAGLIRKANVSNDTTLVRNLNTALAADAKEHKTMQSALDAAAEGGFDIGKINAKTSDNEILWDGENDVFCYLNDGVVEYVPNSVPEDKRVTGSADYYKLWKIYNADEELPAYAEQKFSIYLNGASYAEDENKGLVVSVGLDVGMQTVAKVTYESDADRKVNIRTTGGELNVNAPNGTVSHYEYADQTNIAAIANASYHEFGIVKYAELALGHYVAESGAEVNTLLVTGEGSAVTVDKNGATINNAYASKESAKETAHGGNLSLEHLANAEEIKESLIISSTLFAGGLGTEENPYLVESAEQLENISYSWDEENPVSFKIADGVKEIDCADCSYANLNGNFDGNGVRLTNLNTWLFGFANGKISNLDATMNMVKDSAGLVGNTDYGITFENVKIHGYLQGVTWASPFGSFGRNKVANYKFINCESDATVVATSGTVSGFINHPYCDLNSSTFEIVDSRFIGNLVAPSKNNCHYFATNYGSVNVHVKYSEGYDVSGLYNGAPENGAAFDETVNMGTSLKYNVDKSSVLKMVTGELPEKGEIFSFNKQADTVSADVALIISPNGKDESGSYTGTFMKEQAVVIGDKVNTKDIKYFDIAINGNMTTTTGISGNTFNIVAANRGTTHHGASVVIVEKDVLGNVVCVTTFKIAESTTPKK